MTRSEFPGSWQAHEALGGIYVMAGDTLAAIQNLEKSLELNPGNTAAAEALKRLEGE